MGKTGFSQKNNKKKNKQAAMPKFGIFLVLLCSFMSIAKPKKHFLIETNEDADVTGSEVGNDANADAGADAGAHAGAGSGSEAVSDYCGFFLCGRGSVSGR